MSLFQISEPGQSPQAKECGRRAIGIDLGTTNSLVAHVVDGSPRVIADPDTGDALLPSVVYYGEDRVLVGTAAVEAGDAHPRDAIASVKRFVGRGPEDAEATRKMTPYELVTDDSRVVRFRVSGDRQVSPIEVSAEILNALKLRAEDELGEELEAAVITVPAYFDDAQRQATRDAGRLAGLDVMRLLAEPTAAALAYGLDRGSRGTYAVYDLGGGTFDISILKLVEGVFEVKATGGDSALGGDDFDRLIAEHMLETAGIPHGGGDRRLVRRALREARAAKERLTAGATTRFTVALPDGGELSAELSLEQVTEWCRPLLDKTGRACRRALKDAEIRARELDGVILVGGSTRSPMVRDYVADLFGHQPLCDLDPDQVVALGAAVQAELLAGGNSDVLLLDVIPLSLGLETMGGVVEKIIPRNSTIPTGAEQVFTTYADNQTGFDIHVVQGERESVDDNRSLARFQLKGIPPMVAGMARVAIRFVVDADGILRVSAKEQLTGIENAIEVKPSYGLTDEEVERMLLDSYEHAEEDLRQRNLMVERVEAERILAATRSAMAKDAELLDAETEAATRAAMAALEEAAKGEDHRAIRAAVEALDRASKPFAEKRMNLAVQDGLRGRAVDDV